MTHQPQPQDLPHQESSSNNSSELLTNLQPLPFTFYHTSAAEEPVRIEADPLPLVEEERLCPLLLSVLDHPSNSTSINSSSNTKDLSFSFFSKEKSSMAAPPLPRPAPMETSLTQDLHPHAVVEQEEDPQRCLIDFVEWWCYRLLQATTMADIDTAEGELLKAVENLATTDCEFGRLANRVQMAAFSMDVAKLGSKKEHPLEDHWAMLREELILLKSKLLRQDANADVVLMDKEERQEHLNATPSRSRESSDLFTKEYRHAARLARVQYTLAVFERRLKEVGNSSNGKQLVRKALQDYEKQINQLFSQEQVADDNVSIYSIVSTNVKELPQELAGFLLKDLYQTSKSSGSSPSNSSSDSDNGSKALAERLLQDVKAVVTGNGNYSQKTAKATLRQLLQQWHDDVLEQPTLVQLGYGMPTSAPSPSRRKAEAEEDDMLRRLSTCGGDDAIVLEPTSDIEESPAPPPKKKKFVPLKWIDEGDEDEDDDESVSVEAAIMSPRPPQPPLGRKKKNKKRDEQQESSSSNKRQRHASPRPRSRSRSDSAGRR